MGPDCGTTMIAGTPLAFANVMPEGCIGVGRIRHRDPGAVFANRPWR
jgi:hypothetical protein